MRGPSEYLQLAEKGAQMIGYNIMFYMARVPFAMLHILWLMARKKLVQTEQIESGVRRCHALTLPVAAQALEALRPPAECARRAPQLRPRDGQDIHGRAHWKTAHRRLCRHGGSEDQGGVRGRMRRRHAPDTSTDLYALSVSVSLPGRLQLYTL